MHPSLTRGKVKLSLLRDIGWRDWDPIGLLGTKEYWSDHPEFANEYDSYLLQVVTRFSYHSSVDDVAAYLDQISTEHMGLGQSHAASRAAALRTATAIKTYLDEIGANVTVECDQSRS